MSATQKTSNVRPLRRPTQALLEAYPAKRVAASRGDSRTRKHARLEREVQELRVEVARLLELRSVLKEQALNRPDNHAGSACRIVKQYFDVFQRGYVDPQAETIRPPNAVNGSVNHDSFLSSMMDNQVKGGGFRGVDKMIEQWKRYGSAFVGTTFQFICAEVTGVDVEPDSGNPARIHITASANYAGYLTLAGVQGMFPHVMTNASLVMSLIGKSIGGLGSYEFVYDCVEKRVVENYINIDLVGAFAKVVESAEDLGLLFGEALVTSQYYMGDDSQENTTPLVHSPEPTMSDEEKELVDTQMSLDRILCD